MNKFGMLLQKQYGIKDLHVKQLYRCYIYGATVNGKKKEHNLPLFLLFIDYKKAYDNMNRDKLWEIMDNKIPNYILNTIKCIYKNTKIRIKFNDGISEPIHINKGVRQGCGL